MSIAADNNATLTEIWPPVGRERLALSLGAFERDGRYWFDGSRQDDNAGKLGRMYGTEAAKRARDAGAKTSPYHPANHINGAQSADAPAPATAESVADATSSARSALLARLLAAAKDKPSIEWAGENLDRPQTGAKTSMRAVVTSASLSDGAADSKVLKVVLDYRGFSEHNAVILQGERGPVAFETIEFIATAAEGADSLAAKVANSFQIVAAPAQVLSKGTKTAAEMRTGDDRINLAEVANAEVVRSGETPPAPVPAVNASPVATRVHFWTVKDPESDYHFQKLVNIANEHGIPLLPDRDKKSEHWGLRYMEATREQVEALPDAMKGFLTEAAKKIWAEAKRNAKVSKETMRDAAATAAIEVTTREAAAPAATPAQAAPAQDSQAKAEQPAEKPTLAKAPESPKTEAKPAAPKPLRPLAVPHPEHDREGWMKARDALYNIEPGKLADLMNLTFEARRELEIREDMAATIGQEFSKDDERRLATMTHALKLGEKVLEKKGVRWTSPDRVNAAEAKESAPAPQPAHQPEAQILESATKSKSANKAAQGREG